MFLAIFACDVNSLKSLSKSFIAILWSLLQLPLLLPQGHLPKLSYRTVSNAWNIFFFGWKMKFVISSSFAFAEGKTNKVRHRRKTEDERCPDSIHWTWCCTRCFGLRLLYDIGTRIRIHSCRFFVSLRKSTV